MIKECERPKKVQLKTGLSIFFIVNPTSEMSGSSGYSSAGKRRSELNLLKKPSMPCRVGWAGLPAWARSFIVAKSRARKWLGVVACSQKSKILGVFANEDG